MKKLILLIAVIVGLGALFFALKPHDQTNHQSTGSNTTTKQPEMRMFTITIKGAELVSGGKTMTVHQGDEVHMTVTSDMADELHLHGYDKEVELTPGKPATLSFTANLTGRFEAELHHADKTVFVLEVQPK